MVPKAPEMQEKLPLKPCHYMTIYNPFVYAVALKLPIKIAVPEKSTDYNKILIRRSFWHVEGTEIKPDYSVLDLVTTHYSQHIDLFLITTNFVTVKNSDNHSSEKVLLRQFKALLPPAVSQPIL